MSFFSNDFFVNFYFPGNYLAYFLAAGYLTYYLHDVVKQPLLACGSGKYRQFLLDNVPIIREKFWPTFWCYESRLQTVIGHFVRSFIVPDIKYRREILRLSDGGEVALDWKDTNDLPALGHQSPILVCLPGLSGTSEAEYIRNIALTVTSVGIRCVVFNNRGLAGVPLKTPRPYSAANIEDLSEVLHYVRKENPEVPIAALGVSMGGLILANFLAKRADEAKSLGIVAGVLISVPWNVFVGTEAIEKPFVNAILNRELAASLVATFVQNQHFYEKKLDGVEIVRSRTVREFDSRFTVNVFGYKDVFDYYTHASIHEKIPNIKIPMLCLSAADDPFQPLRGIPVDAANHSENVAILVTARGGHIGFMEGINPFSTNQYMQRVIAQYLTALFHNENYLNFQPKTVN